MNIQEIIETAKAMMAGNKGLLAMDESTPTCNERFSALGIPQNIETRRAYRELIVTAPGLESYISGAILSDETIYQQALDGSLLVGILTRKGIIPGIKVDTGTQDMAGFEGEKITEGLDGLRSRLKEYRQLGARFAKWRAVISIGKDIPSWACMEANTQALALYAGLCQEAGLVPVVEPEVLMAGNHTLEKCGEVSEKVIRILFHHLYMQRVNIQGVILKPSMVLAGTDCPQQGDPDTVAAATLNCLLRSVPAAVPGIAFLSGGQAPQIASANLNAMHISPSFTLPWVVTFSFARAIQKPALEIWKGRIENVLPAQQALVHRARCNYFARKGEYSAAMEL